VGSGLLLIVALINCAIFNNRISKFHGDFRAGARIVAKFSVRISCIYLYFMVRYGKDLGFIRKNYNDNRNV